MKLFGLFGGNEEKELKQLQKEYDEACDQFQADVDASVVDVPIQVGVNRISWQVTMPEDEYDARLQHIDDLATAIKRKKK